MSLGQPEFNPRHLILYHVMQERGPEGALTPKGSRRGPDPKWARKGLRLQRGPRRGPKGVLARACGCGPAATLEGVFKLQIQCKFCHSRPKILLSLDVSQDCCLGMAALLTMVTSRFLSLTYCQLVVVGVVFNTWLECCLSYRLWSPWQRH